MTTTVGSRRVGKHSGARTGPSRLPAALPDLAGAVAAAAAWLFLVRSAVEFGSHAETGGPVTWAFALAASGGAVACLALVLVLASRAARALGLVSDYRPRRAASRRH